MIHLNKFNELKKNQALVLVFVVTLKVNVLSILFDVKKIQYIQEKIE